MAVNKWRKFSSSKYKLVNLGRPAYFLIPSKILDERMPSGVSVRDDLHEFILREFKAFTTTDIPSFGIWHDDSGHPVSDACVQYRVSFVGKKRIPTLLERLSLIAQMAGEDCIYIEAGQYAALLYPKPSS